MEKIYLKIEEEIFRTGIEKILEDKYIVREVKTHKMIKKTDLLITDDNITRDYSVVIYRDLNVAIYSQAKIKLLRSANREELLIALDRAVKNEIYIQGTIKIEEQKLLKFREQLNKLNSRHKQLVSKILENKTNREIASELFLSEKTIKNNLTELYKILEVKSRADLVKTCKIILT